MEGKLEVSFNSPQCGWMAIGFEDDENEFHTTTAYTPHSEALSEILKGLSSLVEAKTPKDEFVIKWSRNPEAYDFHFKRQNDDVEMKVVEFPTFNRLANEAEEVFSHKGNAKQIAQAFYETFEQLYEERNIDEFEDNWRQKFPFEEFEKLKEAIG